MGAGKSMTQVMSDLINATAGPAATPTYVKNTVETECPMFVSLGDNQMGFATWHEECFLPNKLNPEIAKRERQRTEKFKMMELNALNQWARHQRPAAENQQLADIQQQLRGAQEQLAVLQERAQQLQQLAPQGDAGDNPPAIPAPIEQLIPQINAANVAVQAARTALQDQQPAPFVLHPEQLRLMNEISASSASCFSASCLGVSPPPTCEL